MFRGYWGIKKPKPIIVIVLIIILAVSIGLYYYYNTQMAEEKSKYKSISEDERQKEYDRTKAEREAASELEARKENTSFYQKLAEGLDVSILIVGDEISNGSGTTNVVKRWPYLLSEAIRERYGVNISYSSSAIKGGSSYSGYVMVMNADEKAEYDLVILCCGEYDDEDTLGIYYEAAIRAVRKKYVNASIIPVLESSQGDYTSRIKIIQSLASVYDLPVVDTIAPFKRGGDDLVNPDHIHPNDKGQQVYADTIMEIIGQNVADDRGKDGTDIAAVNSNVVYFDNFREFLSVDFKRQGNTFTLKTAIEGNVLGLDYTMVPGDNHCEIYVDGNKIAEIKGTSVSKSDYRVTETVNNWRSGETFNAQNEIMIVFDETETGRLQAKGFKGIVLSGKKEGIDTGK